MKSKSIKGWIKSSLRAFYDSDMIISHNKKRQLKDKYLNYFLIKSGWRGEGKVPNDIGDNKERKVSTKEISDILYVNTARQELLSFLKDNTSYIQIGEGANRKGPLVSIILVLYNKAELTYACLRSIERLWHKNLELIIIDNGSSDETGALLAKLKGNIIIDRQKDNLHFLKGCNRAFGLISKKSKYVLLLNNDATVEALAVNYALEVFGERPNTGIVGGQVLHMNGLLQEAGNVIFRDGICCGIGRGKNPIQPIINVRRKVDYVSGCMLMIDKELLIRLGGFDERFAPAYYEETDLCIRCWQEGREVIYEPKCKIRHIEFASSKQGQSDATQLMVSNREKLEEKHRCWLAHQLTHEGFSDLDSIEYCIRGSAYKARMLWVDDRNPDKRFGAGYGRMQDIIETLLDLDIYVTIFATHQMPDNLIMLNNTDYELIWGGYRELKDLLEKRTGFYTHICGSRHHNLEIIRTWITEIFGGPGEKQDKPVLIADVESLFSIRNHTKDHLQKTGRVSDISNKQMMQLEEIKIEINALREFDKILTVSSSEAEILGKQLNKDVYVAGHAFTAVDEGNKPNYSSTKDLLFMGAMNHPDIPNIDSLEWLASEILPILRKAWDKELALPRLTVIGPSVPSIVDPLFERINEIWPMQYLGQVDDVDDVLITHRLVLAPTRYAAGLPHKVQHAVSQGIPVVTTALIAEQMQWEEGEGIVFSNEALEYAEKIRKYYTDPEEWENVQKRGLVKVTNECQPDSLRQALASSILSS